jgi:hypothetical protein
MDLLQLLLLLLLMLQSRPIRRPLLLRLLPQCPPRMTPLQRDWLRCGLKWAEAD